MSTIEEPRRLSEIRLTPSGHLCWETADDAPESGAVASLRKTFDADWREGLFLLAAEKTDVGGWLTPRF